MGKLFFFLRWLICFSKFRFIFVIIVVVVCAVIAFYTLRFLIEDLIPTKAEKEEKRLLRSDGAVWFRKYIRRHFPDNESIYRVEKGIITTVEDGFIISFDALSDKLIFKAKCNGVSMLPSETVELYSERIKDFLTTLSPQPICEVEACEGFVHNIVHVRIDVDRQNADDISMMDLCDKISTFVNCIGYERCQKTKRIEHLSQNEIKNLLEKLDHRLKLHSPDAILYSKRLNETIKIEAYIPKTQSNTTLLRVINNLLENF